ncbi:diguanylate cyclase domain-containing protein [Haliea sp. E17]|uniref:GGDEF domain-containing protein n=1 Tax=Haliea sp. E17 TaxID=3401576 RepID=UPI003AABBF2C
MNFKVHQPAASWLSAAGLCLALSVLPASADTRDALLAELEAQDSLSGIQGFDHSLDERLEPGLEKAALLREIGYRYESFNAIDDAFDAYDRSVHMLEALPPGEELVQSLGERSYITYLRTGEREDYCPDRERAVAIARDLGNAEVQVEALVKRAFCYDQPETVRRAMADLQEAMDVALQAKLAKDAQAMIFNVSGNLYRSLDLYDRSYDAYYHAYLIWRDQGEESDAFNMLHNLVGSAIPLGRWAEAEQHVQALSSIAERAGDDNDYAFFTRFNRGRLALARGDYAAAEAALGAAIELGPTTAETRFVHHSRMLRGIARFWQQDLPGARADLQEYAAAAGADDAEYQYYSRLADAITRNDSELLVTALQAWRQRELDKRIAFLDANTRLFTAEHESKIAAYESDLLKQRLELQNLELARAEDSARLARQSNLILGLLALILVGLASWLVYRLRLHRERASTDFLTGVANRARVFERGNQLFQRATRRQQPLAVVLIDIDHFKRVNDRYGHEVGDRALRSTVAALGGCLDKGELLGRLGGEEFIVILPRHTAEQARVRAETMRRAVKESARFQHAGRITVDFTASLGVAAGGAAADFQGLVNRADAALYSAKAAGRDRVMLASSLDTPDAAIVGSRKTARTG